MAIIKGCISKQFLNLINENSLLQETLKRVDNLNISDIYIICNEDHRFIVADQILQLKIDAKIILEPLPKNTASCNHNSIDAM